MQRRTRLARLAYVACLGAVVWCACLADSLSTPVQRAAVSSMRTTAIAAATATSCISRGSTDTSGGSSGALVVRPAAVAAAAVVAVPAIAIGGAGGRAPAPALALAPGTGAGAGRGAGTGAGAGAGTGTDVAAVAAVAARIVRFAAAAQSAAQRSPCGIRPGRRHLPPQLPLPLRLASLLRFLLPVLPQAPLLLVPPKRTSPCPRPCRSSSSRGNRDG